MRERGFISITAITFCSILMLLTIGLINENLEIADVDVNANANAKEAVLVLSAKDVDKSYVELPVAIEPPMVQQESTDIEVIAVAERTEKQVIAARGNPTKPAKIKVMESTAYTHTGNATSTGIMPYVGVVAVDPSVIPLGTNLYVEGYGFALAADTGGVIKGDIIDVFMDTRQEALNWGRRQVKVHVLD